MNTDLLTAEDVAIELTKMDSDAITTEPVSAELIPIRDNPYVGIAAAPFSEEAARTLMAPVADSDVEIRPDGLIYLPEIKYRRILNRSFGPGAWSLLPMEITVASSDNMLYYRGALFVHGRFVSEAIGEQQYFPSNDRMSYGTAAESAKSNCLMRCCKDLGIASELWDPQFVKRWLAEYAIEVWCVNGGSKDKGKKRKMWRKKSDTRIDMFPWKEDGTVQKELPPQRTQADVRPTEEKPMSNGHVAPEPDDNSITFRQVKRLRAIASNACWTNNELMELLTMAGFPNAESVSRTGYDQIIASLEDCDCLVMVRERLSAPVVADKPAPVVAPAPEKPAPQFKPATDPSPFISEQRQRSIYQIIERYGWGEGEWAELFLQERCPSVEQMTDRQYPFILSGLQDIQKLREIRNRSMAA